MGASFLLLAGCRGSGHLETVPVSGTVTLDGKPLAQGTVTFAPEMGRAATGAIQPDGSYTLKTYKPGDGALLGKHRVAVVAREVLPSNGPEPYRAGRWLIPVFYSDSAQSGLSFEVKPGKNVYDIELFSTAKPE